MSQTTEWSLESAYPPMRMVEYLPLRKRVVAEWLHCAGLTCGEYDLHDIGDRIEAIIVSELKGTAQSPWKDVRALTKKEGD